MKVAIIGIVGVPANYGGFETLVENLLDYKNSNVISYNIYCSRFHYKEKPKEYKGASLLYVPFKANGFQSILYDVICIIHAAFTAEKLLILGVSGCVILPFIRLFFHKKQIVVNIDGLEHRREKWGKLVRLFLKFSERIAVRFSNIVIADNKAIQDYIVQEYNKKASLIEYGGDNALVNGDSVVLNQINFVKNSYAFSVCRIEPENNIHIILNAFRDMPEHNIVIVGNWDNSVYGKSIFLDFIDTPNIKLLNPIYDFQKLNGLRQNARVYIHGHSAGGTNPSLVEAMMLELPIIAFDVLYNRETTENKAIYFKNSNDLAFIMMNSSDEQLMQNSIVMKSIANRRYVWKEVVKRYEMLIQN